MVLECHQSIQSRKRAVSAGYLEGVDRRNIADQPWGNAADLLLLIASTSAEELQSRQGKKARELLRANVIDDDTDQVWDLLSAMAAQTEKDREIHIVLDNAGFEFISDLVFAAYLLHANYATKVVLHGKAMPWFVSDVTATDLEYTLHTLESPDFNPTISPPSSTSPTPNQDEPAPEPEATNHPARHFAHHLRALLSTSHLHFTAHPFWTTQHPYARLATTAPSLHAQLSATSLVIFKGDLNYRKLVFDGLWPPDTAFATAIGPSLRDGDMRILALRTCKADTCVGLARERVEELEAEEEEGRREWTREGRFGVVSFFDGKGGGMMGKGKGKRKKDLCPASHQPPSQIARTGLKGEPILASFVLITYSTNPARFESSSMYCNVDKSFPGKWAPYIPVDFTGYLTAF